MFNKVIIIGNLTRDVELKYLPSGSAVANIGLASSRRYKKQDGTQNDEVCFVDVNLFGRTAEVANQYLKKGSQVLIEGRLTLESWTDQSGQKRNKHTITAESMQMMGKAQGGDSYGGGDSSYGGDSNSGYQASSAPQNPQNNIPSIDIDDDEIPF